MVVFMSTFFFKEKEKHDDINVTCWLQNVAPLEVVEESESKTMIALE